MDGEDARTVCTHRASPLCAEGRNSLPPNGQMASLQRRCTEGFSNRVVFRKNKKTNNKKKQKTKKQRGEEWDIRTRPLREETYKLDFVATAQSKSALSKYRYCLHPAVLLIIEKQKQFRYLLFSTAYFFEMGSRLIASLPKSYSSVFEKQEKKTLQKSSWMKVGSKQLMVLPYL